MQATVLDKSSKAEFTSLYRTMYLIREFERRSGEMYSRGLIRGFLHLYIGEEAIAVGAIPVLEARDYVVTHYRDHGHALARGVDTKRAMAELFAKKTGVSGGKGGSMHLFDASKNFMGGHAIVGGHLPMACGLALANSYRRNGAVVAVFFGDGAVNQGEFHECMNLAAVWRLPIVFVLENNLYGMGSSVERVHAKGGSFQDAGVPYGIDCAVVDGMDLLAVRESMTEAVKQARSGQGPAFIEAKTYRFQGHSMADPARYRPHDEDERWRHRDPLTTFPDALRKKGLITDDELERIQREVEQEVEEAVQFASESPSPDPADLDEHVYA